MSPDLSKLEQHYMDAYVASPGMVELERVMGDLEKSRFDLTMRTSIIRAVMDSCPYGIVVSSSEDGRFVIWNLEAERILGRGPLAGLVPLDWAEAYLCKLPGKKEICRSEDLPLFRALHGETIKGMELVVGEKETHIVCDAKPVYDELHDQVAAMLTFVDKFDPNHCHDAICSRRIYNLK
jgi:PAS domain-containing protein